jgi:lipopolysaccharide/colanic/teichoic acid biosynthesis glycosyltransferase
MGIRALDILLAGFALVMLAPMLGIVMLVLRFSGEREVFFLQNRVGKDGRQFPLLKFATMLKDSPNIGTGLLTVGNDPRVLPFGKFLRKTKINELPQLINVLKGDMSVIGPRPQAPQHFDVFPAHVKSQLVRVKPGLSGIGSIVFRDEERLLSMQPDSGKHFYANVIAPYKGELEIWYIRRLGVGLYLALIALTVWVILFPDSRAHQKIFRDLPEAPPGLFEA